MTTALVFENPPPAVQEAVNALTQACVSWQPTVKEILRDGIPIPPSTAPSSELPLASICHMVAQPQEMIYQTLAMVGFLVVILLAMCWLIRPQRWPGVLWRSVTHLCRTAWLKSQSALARRGIQRGRLAQRVDNWLHDRDNRRARAEASQALWFWRAENYPDDPKAMSKEEHIVWTSLYGDPPLFPLDVKAVRERLQIVTSCAVVTLAVVVLLAVSLWL